MYHLQNTRSNNKLLPLPAALKMAVEHLKKISSHDFEGTASIFALEADIFQGTIFAKEWGLLRHHHNVMTDIFNGTTKHINWSLVTTTCDAATGFKWRGSGTQPGVGVAHEHAIITQAQIATQQM
jgi:hypothetical protein